MQFFCEPQIICSVSLPICRKGRVIMFYSISRISCMEIVGKTSQPFGAHAQGQCVYCVAAWCAQASPYLTIIHLTRESFRPCATTSFFRQESLKNPQFSAASRKNSSEARVVSGWSDPRRSDVHFHRKSRINSTCGLGSNFFKFPKSKRLNGKSKAKLKINFSS